MRSRQALSRGASARNYRSGVRTNGRNYATAMRGGYRL